jgi:hypothetical protein
MIVIIPTTCVLRSSGLPTASLTDSANLSAQTTYNIIISINCITTLTILPLHRFLQLYCVF